MSPGGNELNNFGAAFVRHGVSATPGAAFAIGGGGPGLSGLAFDFGNCGVALASRDTNGEALLGRYASGEALLGRDKPGGAVNFGACAGNGFTLGGTEVAFTDAWASSLVMS